MKRLNRKVAMFDDTTTELALVKANQFAEGGTCIVLAERRNNQIKPYACVKTAKPKSDNGLMQQVVLGLVSAGSSNILPFVLANSHVHLSPQFTGVALLLIAPVLSLAYWGFVKYRAIASAH